MHALTKFIRTFEKRKKKLENNNLLANDNKNNSEFSPQ